MESETLEDIIESFFKIDIVNGPQSAKNDAVAQYPFEDYNKPKPVLRYIPKEYIDFEQYIKEECHNKIQILKRETFWLIKRPILIFFNHFRKKCSYHTKWLDKLYQLSLKYGDHIEFVAADLIDIDVMYPGSNPINFFCRLVKPEHESPHTYAIDAKKRIHEHFDAYKTVETLLELCENLLTGKLFPSLPIPENNITNSVKICVHHNYEDIILKSPKNVFLIVSLGHCQQFSEPNYENVAAALKKYNLDIVYMEAEKNYIPFEYHVNSYPTILFIPYDDKNHFIYYEDRRNEDIIIEFLRNIMEKPEILKNKQEQLKYRMSQKIVKVAYAFQIDYNNLPKFFEENFDNRFKMLNRNVLKYSKTYFAMILIFMDFPELKCLPHHIQWLNKIYQFVESSYSYQFFVGDFKDIDIINSRWQPQDLRNAAQGKPKIYATDYLKHTYEFGHFDSPSDLYYFIEDLNSRHLYYSQLFPRRNINDKVKEWTADCFSTFLGKSKKHIFITFYSSDDERSEEIFNLLNQIADDVDNLDIEIVKFDVKLNYVDLEYIHDSYPVHYFIPKTNKQSNRFYIDNDLNKDKIIEFIKSNLEM